MVTLNDYLYSGSTIFRILNNYIRDLRKDAKVNHNEIDLVHSNFLIHIQEISICAQLKDRLSCFRDFIAYRIVISLPKCYSDSEEDRKKRELEYLYQIANILPEFLEERGFTAEPAEGIMESTSTLLKEEVRPYYRDYISHNGVNVTNVA